MIVREIEQNPELLDSFDWFNDYKDTLRWAKQNAPHLVPGLVSKYLKYQERIWVRINKGDRP